MTALMAAAARAAHLVVDSEPWIFTDSLATALLGDQAETLLGYHRSHGSHPVLAAARTMVTVRSRYAEDRLTGAIGGGITQYVMLGAGLDTFAYRSPQATRARVIEADHPATQRWKRSQLASAGISPRGDTRYAETDLRAGTLAAALTGAGLDLTRPALISWLGVIMYLDRDAVAGTLAALRHCAAGTELVAEYLVPEDLQDDLGRTYTGLVAPVAAEQGEPWRTFLRPDELPALLAAHGFTTVANVPQREAVDPSLWDRTDALRPPALSWLVHARHAG
jgi:methyltransferase (TIGR00027 family)